MLRVLFRKPLVDEKWLITFRVTPSFVDICNECPTQDRYLM